MSSMVEELLGNESFVANILKSAKLEEEEADPEEEDDYKRYREYMERRAAYEERSKKQQEQGVQKGPRRWPPKK